jgi:hypothetical protein
LGELSKEERQSLPHRRPVRWFAKTLTRDDMSDALKRSAGSIATVSDLTDDADELERLLSGNAPQTTVATDAPIEDASVFALEKHLEDFLVQSHREMTAPGPVVAELHVITFRAMQRLLMETLVDQLCRRPLAAEIRREADALVQTPRRSALLRRRLWFARGKGYVKT